MKPRVQARSRRPKPQAQPDLLRPLTLDPVQLAAQIQKGVRSPKDLTPDQRRACLVVMAQGKRTPMELASFFQVAPGTIRNDLLAIRQDLGREVAAWTPEQVLGRLVFSAEKYQAAAMRQDDPALAWTIEKDTIKLLHDLGVIGPKVDRHTVTFTMETLAGSYERAAGVLQKRLDPRLTGEITVEGKTSGQASSKAIKEEAQPPRLELKTTLPGKMDEHEARERAQADEQAAAEQGWDLDE